MRFKIASTFFLLLFNAQLLPAQLKPAEGFFTSEANTVTLGDDIIVSIKKYNPTAEELKKAQTPPTPGALNYLQITPAASNITLTGKAFESDLYCIDKNGNQKWKTLLGYSKRSAASVIASFNGFIYAGEAVKDDDKIMIQKIDTAGKIIWSTPLDSLQNVNSICIDDNKLNALVSFESSPKAYGKKDTSYRPYPIYFFLQLDLETGKMIKKQYQLMGNYLSKLYYSNPKVNSSYSYFLNNRDSAVFLNVDKQDGATVISQAKDTAASIVALIGGKQSYHYLTLRNHPKDKEKYQLVSGFYATEKTYVTDMPAKYNPMFGRFFLYKNDNDSVLTAIQSLTSIELVYTDTDGKANTYKTVTNIMAPLLTMGVQQDKVYLVYLDGRKQLGKPGTIKINYY